MGQSSRGAPDSILERADTSLWAIPRLPTQTHFLEVLRAARSPDQGAGRAGFSQGLSPGLWTAALSLCLHTVTPLWVCALTAPSHKDVLD